MPEHTTLTHGDRQAKLLHAGKEIFQRRLADIVRPCLAGSPGALAAFEREVGDAHDQLVSASREAGFDQVSDLTASRLTLMGDDDLELDIRMRSIGAHLREAGGRPLTRCRLRYMSLLQWPATTGEENHPLTPEVICLGLWAICRESVRGLDQTLALLDRIEERLRQQVPLLYHEIDEFLANHGIDPVQTSDAPARNVGDKASEALLGKPPSNSRGSTATLHEMIRQGLAGEQAGLPLPFSGSDKGRPGNPALDAAARVSLNHLLDRLGTLEASAAAGEPSLRGLRSKDFDLPPGRPEAITMDTLGLIFEAMFDSGLLPEALKAALGRLQIPLLKLAIDDPTLLANEIHPARQLINRLGRAALGLPRDAGTAHPLCQRLGRLTTVAGNSLGQPDRPLGPYLAELAALIDERDQTTRRAADPYIGLLRTHENREYSSQLAGTWLRASLARTRSAEIASFLEDYWSRVMIGAATESGTQDERWQQHSRTADDLIWSVLPKQSPEERKRLAGMASSLLKRIAAGLDEIGVSAAERSPFLNTLFDLQTAALRSQAQAPAARLSGAPGVATRSAPKTSHPAHAPRLIEQGGRKLLHLSMPTLARSPQAPPAGDWRVGEWLRIELPDEGQQCGLCCWQSPSSGTVLLFNPDWEKAVAAHRSFLDQQLAAGQAQIASRIALFDSGAERALGRLMAR